MSDAIREAVHAEVDAKINAGTQLEASIERHAAAVEVATAAERDVNEARRKALQSGWTETQLRKLGLASPPTRTRRTRSPKPHATNE